MTSAAYRSRSRGGLGDPTSWPWLTCTRTPPISRSIAAESRRLPGTSVLPYTASTGAISASSSSTSSPPTSPACRMSVTPASASWTSARTSPWVSEISPMTLGPTGAPSRSTRGSGRRAESRHDQLQGIRRPLELPRGESQPLRDRALLLRRGGHLLGGAGRRVGILHDRGRDIAQLHHQPLLPQRGI